MEASASNLFAALVNGSLVISATCFAKALANSGFELRPGADGGAALRQRKQLLHGDVQARDAALDLRGVAGEFLAERQRCRVLGMRASDLHDLGERLLLPVQRLMQLGERGNQVGDDAACGRDMHRGRKRVVRGLAHVDMIVRMDRLLGAELAAEHLVGAVGDHLVDVHVGLRAGAGLPDDQRKMIVELAVDHFLRCAGNGVGAARIELAEFAIGLGGRELHHGKRVDDRDRHPVVADFEILPRAFGLRAPVAVGGNVDRAEAVGLAAGGGVGCCGRLSHGCSPLRHQNVARQAAGFSGAATRRRPREGTFMQR
ncbi:hypothetical protein ACVMB0_006966 [Bradyrhizobium sp. USDA 4451]